MSFDPHEFVRAASNRITNDGSFPDRKTFKGVLEGRNNEKILDYLNDHGKDRIYFEVSGHISLEFYFPPSNFHFPVCSASADVQQ